jgi:hypothetical protein
MRAPAEPPADVGARQVGLEVGDEFVGVCGIEQDLDDDAGGAAAHLLGVAGDAARRAVAVGMLRDEGADPFGMPEQVVDHLFLQRFRQQQLEAGIASRGTHVVPQRR